MSKLLAGVVILLLLYQTFHLVEANVRENKLEWAKRMKNKVAKALGKKLPKTLKKVINKALDKELLKILKKVLEKLSKIWVTDLVKTFLEKLSETLIENMAEDGAPFVGSMVCGPVWGITGKV